MSKIALAALLAAATLAAPAHAEPDFSADRFKAHVSFLADDLLEGRAPGQRGYDIAARYIATQFALLGLKPGGENGGWYQNVTLLETTLDTKDAALTVTGKSGQTVLRRGVEASLRGKAGGGVTEVDAPLVFVGYGMKDAAAGVDDYKGLDVRGKVVVVLWGVPPGMDSEIAAHLQSRQARTASEQGAIGMIGVPTRLTSKTFPWKRSVAGTGGASTTFVHKDGTPDTESPNVLFSSRVGGEFAGPLFEGAAKTYEQVLDIAEAAKARPKGFPLKTRISTKFESSSRTYESAEIIGLIEGADPKLKDEYVVLMGHADHIGVKRNAKPGEDAIYNGALDNASGVATLLEVARAFATEPQRPRRSVLIIANTAEEKGLLGADYFAHYPTVPADKIVGGVDLDMPMLTYDFTDVVAYGGDHSTISESIRRAAAGLGVALSPDPQPEQAIFVRSDHYTLVQTGVPAVMLATGWANGGTEAWATYFAKHYHQPADDLSQPIVWSAGAKFAHLNYRIARDLADQDARPQWYAGDYFGNLFAPKAPKAAKPSAAGTQPKSPASKR